MSEQVNRMQALQLHHYGAPLEVVGLQQVALPKPKRGQIRIRVYACGLNPADAALCQGFMPSTLPRGIGLDVSGTVEQIGEDVSDVQVGDNVFGVPDFMAQGSAGAAEYAVLAVWQAVPKELTMLNAAALPMVVETATRTLDLLDLKADMTILINGGGTMVGFAAVQMALLRGARVISTAGETYAGRLRDLGAQVTSYGAGMVERVRELAGGPIDLALQTAMASAALPDVIAAVGGDPRRVLSIGDPDAQAHGVRTSGGDGFVARYDALAPFAKLAAEGKFTVPIAHTFELTDWRKALALVTGGKARGKVMLIP